MRANLVLALGLLAASCTSSPIRSPFDPERFAFADEELVEFEGGGVVETVPGTWISYPVVATRPFDRALVSWNVDLAPGAGYEVELRVRPDGESWSPWFFLDAYGTVPEETRGARRSESSAGRVDVDEFFAARPERAAQVRFRLHGPARVRRVSLSLRETGERFADAAQPRVLLAPSTAFALAPLVVPALSQFDAAPEIAPRLCTPTSLAMVLRGAGIETDPETVARRTFDPLHDLYGNWPRAIQTAYGFGLEGRAAHLSGLGDLVPWLAGGHPVICSIAFAEGELPGAPIASTDGHLLVVRGFTAAGDVLVADPAAPDASKVLGTYPRAEFERAWLGHGGVALLFGEPVLPEPVKTLPSAPDPGEPGGG
ncbi:MAG TPA: peptidase C39 family protein [Planctomycetes bacterium]|nr:peptidase C39 family protein [Planctomycetota bacterium]